MRTICQIWTGLKKSLNHRLGSSEHVSLPQSGCQVQCCPTRKPSNFGAGCFMLALNTQPNESDLKNLNLSSATSKCQTPWKIRSPKDCELSKRGRARLARRLASRGQKIKRVHSSPWKFLNYKELLRGSCQKQQALMFASKFRWNKTCAVLEKERYDVGIKATFQVRLASV